ncbi:glycosyl hydrolase family 28-related protein [uncultured Paludibaculum sp.]|uniref:glycosyl hydrolase family 28-related protein n=1 Tax=uncultured Paludibaculum sp. TaxID=1765020 RepID=UPI002AAB521F|nr:glycosyl hydrolase family 28-related protein [uncultured Paludibaculum sp.]
MMRFILFGMIFGGLMLPANAASVFRTRPDDAKAVYLTQDRFAVRADGMADDSAGLQAAIDKVQETTGEGIVFIPQGRYRLTRTIYVWPSIRLIGYGEQRPVFVLTDHTPGFQEGVSTMVFFAGMRPGQGRGFRLPPPPPGTVPFNKNIADANPGTFYSAMTNIDFEIGNDNAAAVAVRFHAAQHGYLAHMDFHLGSGLAGIHDAGNIAYDVHFHGGRYGILTKKPSPAWQFSVIDATFDGQREAAIRENEAQLTVVHCEFRNVPTAIAIDTGYSDQLWVKDARFVNISGPALIISNEKSRMTQINVESSVCQGVPVFARFRESGKQLAGAGAVYQVKSLSHGLALAGAEAVGLVKTVYDAATLPSMPATGADALKGLPAMEQWVNLKSLGVKGDGVTDETAALQKAINENPVIYIPMGHYVVSGTITLRPDSVLIGLHPDETQLDVIDGTAAFQGPGGPKPLLLAPRGGKNLVTGIGLYTGGANSRAVGAMWMAGKDSQMDDVRFLGGHGTRGPSGKREQPYNSNLSADPDPRRRWDGQYPSLWVTHGGGGTFSNLWTPSTFAQTGLYVSDTKTPGMVYQVSSEHHVRTEVKIDQVENWDFYALQTEGERGESESASALEISRSKNLTIANFHGYRVVRSYHPFPYAISVSESSNIRFRNIHVDNNSSLMQCTEKDGCRQYVRQGKVSYGTCIWDPVLKAEVRDREFAFLDWTGTKPAAPAPYPTTVVAAGARVERLAGGFYNAAGGAVDAAGRLYFVDAHWHRIYRWAPEKKSLAVVRDSPLDPVNLVFDKAGNLIVMSSGGSSMAVYAFKPDGPEDEVQVLEPQPAQERAGAAAVLPVNYWVNGDFTNTLDTDKLEYVTLDQMFRKVVTTRTKHQYVSPDGSLFIPSDEVIVQGPAYLGYKWAYILQAYGLVKAEAGRPFYVTNESDQRTYRGNVNADGTLGELRTFVEQGGENLTQDRAGNVYLAAGQVFVYTPAGKLIDVIRVPERPVNLVFGGSDGRTLFVLTQSSLYSIRTK